MDPLTAQTAVGRLTACRHRFARSGVTFEAGVPFVTCSACCERVHLSPQLLTAQRLEQAAESGAIPSQRPANPFAPPRQACPKCIAPRYSTANACGKCGVVFKHFLPWTVTPSALLARAWSDVVVRWSDDYQHLRFRQLAVMRNELVAAERLYAIWLAYLPKDPWGLRGKQELSGLRATAQAKAEVHPKLSVRMLVGLATLVLVAGSVVVGLT